jgi:phosphoglycerate dehydrogenase-like enzyme
MRILLNMGYSLSADQRTTLSGIHPGIEAVIHREVDPDTLEGADVDVLVTEQVPRRLEKWPRLRWVQLFSAGSNHLRDHPIWETSIVVTNASGTHGVPIAQYVTMTWLMMVHRVPELFEFKRTRVWPDREALAAPVVRGMTAGVIGYGGIGRECARQLGALGMKILCLKRNPDDRCHRGNNPWPGTGDPDGTIPSVWYRPDQIAEMLPLCDVVVVTVPKTRETEGMIGAAELALMKKGARLIIISRGGIVDEDALAASLRNNHLAGAAVDCFVREPLTPDHVFFDVPNLIMTPHVSGIFLEYWPVMFTLLAENMRRFQNGLPLMNEVSRNAGY